VTTTLQFDIALSKISLRQFHRRVSKGTAFEECHNRGYIREPTNNALMETAIDPKGADVHVGNELIQLHPPFRVFVPKQHNHVKLQQG
jgi:hypothetical protein